ncbi:hypothetical protein BsWGS_19482 [Bradybaena similaris]
MDDDLDFDQTQAVVISDLEDDDLTDDLQSSAEKEPSAYLRVLPQKGLPGSSYPLYEGDNIIGRQADTCHVCISSKSLSKEHACIEITGDSHLIFDKGSRNKTRRGKLVLKPEIRYELKHSDVLSFADVKCVYEIVRQISEIVPESDAETEAESDVSEPLHLMHDVTDQSDKLIDLTGDKQGSPHRDACVSGIQQTLVLSESDSEDDDDAPSGGLRSNQRLVRETVVFESSDDDDSCLNLIEMATQAYTKSNVRKHNGKPGKSSRMTAATQKYVNEAAEELVGTQSFDLETRSAEEGNSSFEGTRHKGARLSGNKAVTKPKQALNKDSAELNDDDIELFTWSAWTCEAIDDVVDVDDDDGDRSCEEVPSDNVKAVADKTAVVHTKEVDVPSDATACVPSDATVPVPSDATVPVPSDATVPVPSDVTVPVLSEVSVNKNGPTKRVCKRVPSKSKGSAMTVSSLRLAETLVAEDVVTASEKLSEDIEDMPTQKFDETVAVGESVSEKAALVSRKRPGRYPLHAGNTAAATAPVHDVSSSSREIFGGDRSKCLKSAALKYVSEEANQAYGDISDEPTQCLGDISEEPTQAYVGISEEPTQAYIGICDEPTQAYIGICDEPTQAYIGICDEPTQAYIGICDEPTQAYSGICDEPTQDYSGVSDQPTQVCNNVGEKSARDHSGISDKPTQSLNDTSDRPTQILNDTSDRPTQILNDTSDRPTQILNDSFDMPTQLLNDSSDKPTKGHSDTYNEPTQTFSIDCDGNGEVSVSEKAGSSRKLRHRKNQPGKTDGDAGAGNKYDKTTEENAHRPSVRSSKRQKSISGRTVVESGASEEDVDATQAFLDEEDGEKLVIHQAEDPTQRYHMEAEEKLGNSAHDLEGRTDAPSRGCLDSSDDSDLEELSVLKSAEVLPDDPTHLFESTEKSDTSLSANSEPLLVYDMASDKSHTLPYDLAVEEPLEKVNKRQSPRKNGHIGSKPDGGKELDSPADTKKYEGTSPGTESTSPVLSIPAKSPLKPALVDRRKSPSPSPVHRHVAFAPTVKDDSVGKQASSEGAADTSQPISSNISDQDIPRPSRLGRSRNKRSPQQMTPLQQSNDKKIQSEISDDGKLNVTSQIQEDQLGIEQSKEDDLEIPCQKSGMDALKKKSTVASQRTRTQRSKAHTAAEDVKTVSNTPPLAEDVNPVDSTPPLAEDVNPVDSTPPLAEDVNPVDSTPPLAEDVNPVDSTPPLAEDVNPVDRTPPLAEGDRKEVLTPVARNNRRKLRDQQGGDGSTSEKEGYSLDTSASKRGRRYKVPDEAVGSEGGRRSSARPKKQISYQQLATGVEKKQTKRSADPDEEAEDGETASLGSVHNSRNKVTPSDDSNARDKKSAMSLDGSTTKAGRKSATPLDDSNARDKKSTMSSDGSTTKAGRKSATPLDDSNARDKNSVTSLDDTNTKANKKSAASLDGSNTKVRKKSAASVDDSSINASMKSVTSLDESSTTATMKSASLDDSNTKAGNKSSASSDECTTKSSRQSVPPSDDSDRKSSRKSVKPIDDSNTKASRKSVAPSDDSSTKASRKCVIPVDDSKTIARKTSLTSQLDSNTTAGEQQNTKRLRPTKQSKENTGNEDSKKTSIRKSVNPKAEEKDGAESDETASIASSVDDSTVVGDEISIQFMDNSSGKDHEHLKTGIVSENIRRSRTARMATKSDTKEVPKKIDAYVVSSTAVSAASRKRLHSKDPEVDRQSRQRGRSSAILANEETILEKHTKELVVTDDPGKDSYLAAVDSAPIHAEQNSQVEAIKKGKGRPSKVAKLDASRELQASTDSNLSKHDSSQERIDRPTIQQEQTTAEKTSRKTTRKSLQVEQNVEPISQKEDKLQTSSQFARGKRKKVSEVNNEQVEQNVVAISQEEDKVQTSSQAVRGKRKKAPEAHNEQVERNVAISQTEDKLQNSSQTVRGKRKKASEIGSEPQKEEIKTPVSRGKRAAKSMVSSEASAGYSGSGISQSEVVSPPSQTSASAGKPTPAAVNPADITSRGRKSGRAAPRTNENASDKEESGEASISQQEKSSQVSATKKAKFSQHSAMEEDKSSQKSANSSKRKTADSKLSQDDSQSNENTEHIQEQVTTPCTKKSKQTPILRTPAGKAHTETAESPVLRKSSTNSKPHVMFTGYIDKQGEKDLLLFQIVQDLGGELVSSVQECSHLVTDRICRTVKFLSGLAKGLLIVSPRWLESCKQAGTFVDGHQFLVSDPAMEKQYKFSLATSIGKAQAGPLLSGYKVHVTTSVKPNPAQMQDILKFAGAQYMKTMPNKSQDKLVVISCSEDRPLCLPAVNAGIPVVGAEFILTGILRQEVDFESFSLFQDESKSQKKTGKKK